MHLVALDCFAALAMTACMGYIGPMPICPVQLTKDLIACPSVTPRDEGAQVLLGRHLRDMGFACHPMAFGEVPNLFARLGSAGPHLCYAGHTDVVPPGPLDAWTSPPFTPTVRDGVLYGRGASDMKGSVACFTAAVSRYLDAHGPPPGSISLLITGDEEGPAVDGTAKVLEWAEREGHLPDVALVGEPTNPDSLGERIKIGRRGSLTGRITVRGRQGHAAYPARCDNPVPRLVKLLAALTAEPLDDGNAFFDPSTLQIVRVHADAGAENTVPGMAQATFNSRFCSDWSGESLAAHMRERLDATGVDYEIKFEHGSEVFLTDPGPWPDLVASAVEDATGRVPARTTDGGTSDAKFFHRHCPVVECGGVNATIHQVDECASLDDLEGLTRIYLRVLERYFGAV